MTALEIAKLTLSVGRYPRADLTHIYDGRNNFGAYDLIKRNQTNAELMSLSANFPVMDEKILLVNFSDVVDRTNLKSCSDLIEQYKNKVWRPDIR